jgi:molybdopterin molybdotransferase
MRSIFMAGLVGLRKDELATIRRLGPSRSNISRGVPQMAGDARPQAAPVSLDAAVARVDAAARRLAAERVGLGEANGRVLAEDIRAAAPVPAEDRAARDGFAVRAETSLGAGAYNPLDLPLVAAAAGAALPAGTDAVIPLATAEPDGLGHIGVVEPLAPGDNVVRQGAVAAAGALLAAAGTRLACRHIGLLASAGVEAVPVVRRPRVQILLLGPMAPGMPESNSPMLRAAVARDGGIVAAVATLPRERPSLAAALAAADADIVLVGGGTGPGPDDYAAAALGEIGEIVFHGVALCPGESAGLGRTGNGVPVLLLPGMPAACLWSYELFAGRAIRRLAGHDPRLPYRTRAVTVTRKIVSAIGTTEICPVRLGPGDTIEPLPSFAEIGLGAAAAAAGFVVIPAAREGYPAGAKMLAYLYDEV